MKVPAAQGRQVDCPGVAVNPAGQFVHMLAPDVLEKVPAAQAVHTSFRPEVPGEHGAHGLPPWPGGQVWATAKGATHAASRHTTRRDADMVSRYAEAGRLTPRLRSAPGPERRDLQVQERLPRSPRAHAATAVRRRPPSAVRSSASTARSRRSHTRSEAGRRQPLSTFGGSSKANSKKRGAWPIGSLEPRRARSISTGSNRRRKPTAAQRGPNGW